MKVLANIVIVSNLVLSGCFMESAVPLSPVEQADYPVDLVDTWVMLHNRNAIIRIEKLDRHQLRIVHAKRDTGIQKDNESFGHISHINAKTYFNNQPLGHERYVIYRFERICQDLILIYIPDQELIDNDIKSGRVKGRIVQDFFTYRIFEENREGLIKYIQQYEGRLFVPFRYIVRRSKAENLPQECKIIKYPGVPISHKKERYTDVGNIR